MKAYKTQDMKRFTSCLFAGDNFDDFLTQEAEITTCCRFMIDGKVRSSWYTDAELESKKVEEYCSWRDLRPVCFDLIKGKKLPESFRIVLRYPPDKTENLLKRESLDPACAGGLFWNIRYEEGKLLCISMASPAFFTADKTLEHVWDSFTEQLLRENGIAVSEDTE